MRLCKPASGSLVARTLMYGVGSEVRGGNPRIFTCHVEHLDLKFISVPRYHWLLGFCRMNGGCPWDGVGPAHCANTHCAVAGERSSWGS